MHYSIIQIHHVRNAQCQVRVETIQLDGEKVVAWGWVHINAMV